MNDQQVQIELVDFLSEVFGLPQETPVEKKAQYIQETLGKLDQKSQEAIMQASMQVAQQVATNKIQKGGQEYKAAVASFQKQLGITSSPLTAKLGGILNYINKLNTIR